MKRAHRWLHHEIDLWQQEGLVEPGQADALRRRYPVVAPPPLGRLILSVLGAVIFGLGVILFFAYNWQEMSKAAKLGVLFTALLAAHAGGFWQRAKGAGRRPRVEAFHLLGTMLFGAGIWLVSQIYHVDNPYPGALVLWGLGALALAWTLPSIPQALLALVLIVAWALSEIGGYDGSWSFPATCLIAAGLLPLGVHLRSRTLVLAMAAALMVILPVELAAVYRQLVPLLLVSLAASYVALARLAKERSFWAPIGALGHLLYFAVVFIVSFDGALRSLPQQPDGWAQWLGFVAVLGAPLALLTLALVRKSAPAYARELLDTDNLWLLLVMAMLSFLALAQLGVVPSDRWWHALPATLVLLGHGVMLVLEGTRQDSMARATAGSLLIAVVAMARFSDLFDSLLARSLAFLLIGAGFVAAGAFFSKHRDGRISAETHHA